MCLGLDSVLFWGEDDLMCPYLDSKELSTNFCASTKQPCGLGHVVFLYGFLLSQMNEFRIVDYSTLQNIQLNLVLGLQTGVTNPD